MIATASATTVQLDDSYDQAKLTALKREITLSKSQLFELTNDDRKFGQKLKHFNQMGCESILREELYEAIIYLNEAEIILEYAANCGKTIERSLIITTLHNQACVYQRMWELEKAGDYIEGIIYNIISYLQAEQIDLTGLEQQGQEEYARVSALMQNKLSLAAYYLQFCAVSSQNKNHEHALSAASKALDTLKQICEIESKYEEIHHLSSGKPSLLIMLNKISLKSQTHDTQHNISKYLNEALKAIKLFHSTSKTTLIDIDPKEKQQLIDFSIGNLMQINPMEIPESSEKDWLKQQFSPLKKVYKAIHISIAHFTMATELRLIAGDRYALDMASRKTSVEFKTSQLHHLISIITVALYVPYKTVYLQHILNSFKNHYQLDLAILSSECDVVQSKLDKRQNLMRQMKKQNELEKDELKTMQNIKHEGKQTEDSINTMDRVKNKSLRRKLKMTTEAGGFIESITSIQLQRSSKQLPKIKKPKQSKEDTTKTKGKQIKQKKCKHQKDRLTATNRFQILVSPPHKNESLTKTMQMVKSPKKPHSNSKAHKTRNSKSKNQNVSAQKSKRLTQNIFKVSHYDPKQDEKVKKGLKPINTNNLQSDTEYGLKKNGYYLGILNQNAKKSLKSISIKNQKRSSKSISKQDTKHAKTHKNPQEFSRQEK